MIEDLSVSGHATNHPGRPRTRVVGICFSGEQRPELELGCQQSMTEARLFLDSEELSFHRGSPMIGYPCFFWRHFFRMPWLAGLE